MPTYDYRCPSCNKVEQHIHKMSDDRFQALCLDCFNKGRPCEMVKGIGGGTAVHFKGNGFYETDYKKK